MVGTATKRKAGGRGAQGKGSKGGKRAKDDFLDENVGSLIFADDEELNAGATNADGAETDEGLSDDDEQETAEQRRLRLAKAYIQQLRQGQQEDQAEEFVGVTGGEADERLAAQLREDALEADGRLRRRIAHRVQLPPLPAAPSSSSLDTARPRAGSGVVQQAGLYPAGSRLLSSGHRLAVTALALTEDARTAYSVSKCGAIMAWDLETGKGSRMTTPAEASGSGQAGAGAPAADWVQRKASGLPRGALVAAAVSPDGRYLAVGGADHKVHVYDARTREYMQGFNGHQGPVACLAFRQGPASGGQLVSGSYDRTVKVWSLQDKMYIDTLFGHQAEVLCIDMGRSEIAVSGAYDRTCRVWKIAESKQAVHRAPSMATESVAYVSRDEWVSGGGDGTLSLWQAARKKPAWRLPGAHAPEHGDKGELLGAGSVGGDVSTWVTAVACARGSDLVASGGGDGVVRLWGARAPGDEAGTGLDYVGGLPVRGFVNSLALASSGEVMVAGLGQEPRLGRWAKDGAATNGVLVTRLQLNGDDE